MYRVVRRLKYADGKLDYVGVPLFEVDEIAPWFHLPKRLGTPPVLEYTLRLVEQGWERHRTASGTTHGVAAYALCEQDETLHAAQISGPRVKLRIRVPDGVPGSALHRDHPLYWELEVRANVPGIDDHGLFLLPTYQRPRSVQTYG